MGPCTWHRSHKSQKQPQYLIDLFLVLNQKIQNQYHQILPLNKSASKLYRPSDRSLSAKFVPTFGDRGCSVVSAIDPHGRILGFIDQSRYYFFQVAPQLYSRGWVDPLFLEKSGSGGNRTGDL
jgi:hypothetical protein